MLKERFEIGIDEAGRGALIGPMVVAGVKADSGAVRLLKKLGVRDSKRLSPLMREKLYYKMIEFVDHAERIYPAFQIDGDSLTTLELEAVSEIINLLGIQTDAKIIMDCIGKLAKKKVEDALGIPNGIEFIYEPKADDSYPVCQAASIIAKVTRDREVRKIHEKVGFNFGKGYPTKDTIKFVRRYKERNGKLPPEIRKRWRSIVEMF